MHNLQEELEHSIDLIKKSKCIPFVKNNIIGELEEIYNGTSRAFIQFVHQHEHAIFDSDSSKFLCMRHFIKQLKAKLEKEAADSAQQIQLFTVLDQYFEAELEKYFPYEHQFILSLSKEAPNISRRLQEKYETKLKMAGKTNDHCSEIINISSKKPILEKTMIPAIRQFNKSSPVRLYLVVHGSNDPDLLGINGTNESISYHDLVDFLSANLPKELAGSREQPLLTISVIACELGASADNQVINSTAYKMFQALERKKIFCTLKARTQVVFSYAQEHMPIKKTILAGYSLQHHQSKERDITYMESSIKNKTARLETMKEHIFQLIAPLSKSQITAVQDDLYNIQGFFHDLPYVKESDRRDDSLKTDAEYFEEIEAIKAKYPHNEKFSQRIKIKQDIESISKSMVSLDNMMSRTEMSADERADIRDELNAITANKARLEQELQSTEKEYKVVDQDEALLHNSIDEYFKLAKSLFQEEDDLLVKKRRLQTMSKQLAVHKQAGSKISITPGKNNGDPPIVKDAYLEPKSAKKMKTKK